MKKKYIGIIIVVILLILLSRYWSIHNTTSIEDGTYIMEQKASEIVWLPQVTISKDQITFTYDAVSSYLPIGSYSIKNDLLTMTTYDNWFTYVFQIDGDKLIFLKDKSSIVKLIDERIGVKVTDKAVFRRIKK